MWDTIKYTIIYTLGGIEEAEKNVGISNSPRFPKFDEKKNLFTYTRTSTSDKHKRFTPKGTL